MKKTGILAVLLFSALVIISVPACYGNEDKKGRAECSVIDLEASVGKGIIVNLSEIVSEIQYIPLETSDSSLIGDVKKIHYENGLFYISSSRIFKDGIQIFDFQGHFLRKFNRKGRGPEEYSHISGYDILPGVGLIDIYAGVRNIYRYDIYGKYIRRFFIPQGDRFRVYPGLYVNDTTYAAVISDYFKGIPEYSAILFTPGDTTIKYLMSIPGFQQKNPFDFSDMFSGSPDSIKSVGINVLLYRYKDRARLIFPYNDTIFSISPDMRLETPVVIHYGKTRFPGGGKYERRKYISMKKAPLESDDYLFMSFNLNDFAHEPFEKEIIIHSTNKLKIPFSDCFALLNKKNGDFTLLNQPEKTMPGIKEDLLNGPPFWPKYVASTGELVSLYTSEELIEWAKKHEVSPKLKKIIDNLEYEDNPVVVLAK